MRRAPNTARATRPANTLFTDLNQPIRNKKRGPVDVEPVVQTPRGRIRSQRGMMTDTATFRSVGDKTQTVDSLMKSVRRDKTSRVQQWINENDPKPLEILRHIAEESQPHKRILTLICDQLEAFPPSALQEPIVDLNDDAADEIANIRVRSHDMAQCIDDLAEEENALDEELEDARSRWRDAKAERDRYADLVNASTFEAIEKEREDEERASWRAKELVQTTRRAYNELWGENKHIKSELSKMQKKIDDQRKIHQELIAQRAMEIIEERMIPDVTPM